MDNMPKILIVDDTLTDTNLLSRLLEKNGYDVQTINNGNKICNFLESNKPDLILLDIMTADTDSYETCRKIKEDKTNSEIPIIFIAERTETDDIIERLDSGGIDYITKPFSTVEALARIRIHLKIKSMYEQNLLYQKELLMSQKMASITTLAGGIAHNINNLMGAVVGYTDMLRISLNGHDKARDYTEKILEASQRVTELTHNLLTYSRAIRSEPINVNVKDLLQNMVMLYGNSSQNANLDINIPDSISEVYVDRTQVSRALANIFINAKEVTPKDSTVSISVNTDSIPRNVRSDTSNIQKDDYVVISISDKGPGMDELTANRIFEPFFTTKQTVGSGLGLSAASGIIQKNNGFIHLDTKLGKGSTFHIYLPKGKEVQHEN